jgi:hypothetical protein
MSAAEILAELPKLTTEERLEIYRRIAEMEGIEEIEPGPEFHAAIEQGLRSLGTEPVVPLEEVREKIAQWAGRSS